MSPSIPKLISLLSLLAAVSACAVAVSAGLRGETAHTAATELTWADSGFGPRVSAVDGDFSKGSHITYVKFTEGMATQLHTHTHDYTGIVITGTTMHWEPGKPETRKQLSAGAHWFVPANVPHVSECLPGMECLMAIYQNDPMDFLPVE